MDFNCILILGDDQSVNLESISASMPSRDEKSELANLLLFCVRAISAQRERNNLKTENQSSDNVSADGPILLQTRDMHPMWA